MGEIRSSRVTVPGAIFLLSALISLWVGGMDIPRTLVQGSLAGPLFVAVISGISGGYLCSALVVFVITLVPGLLFPPPERLRGLLGMPDGIKSRLQLSVLQDYVFHSAAPAGLIESVRSRLDAYFAACNSIVAMWVGFGLPVFFGFTGGADHRVLAVVLIGLTLMLLRIAWRARVEIWELASVWHTQGAAWRPAMN